MNLLPGATPILIDIDPQYSNYDTKGFFVDNGQYKLINYQFQPSMVPEDVLAHLLDLSLDYLYIPANGTTVTTTTETTPTIIDPIPLMGSVVVGGLIVTVWFIKFRPKPRKGDSIWIRKKE